MHVCGHAQAHFLTGFASQQDRKARWLGTTKCGACFADDKRLEQVEAAARAEAAIAHLGLPQLAGSERQIAWATTIRARRIAAIVAASAIDGDDLRPLSSMADAKWWIDSRHLTDTDILGKARLPASPTADCNPIENTAQAASTRRLIEPAHRLYLARRCRTLQLSWSFDPQQRQDCQTGVASGSSNPQPRRKAQNGQVMTTRAAAITRSEPDLAISSMMRVTRRCASRAPMREQGTDEQIDEDRGKGGHASAYHGLRQDQPSMSTISGPETTSRQEGCERFADLSINQRQRPLIRYQCALGHARQGRRVAATAPHTVNCKTTCQQLKQPLVRVVDRATAISPRRHFGIGEHGFQQRLAKRKSPDVVDGRRK